MEDRSLDQNLKWFEMGDKTREEVAQYYDRWIDPYFGHVSFCNVTIRKKDAYRCAGIEGVVCHLTPLHLSREN